VMCDAAQRAPSGPRSGFNFRNQVSSSGDEMICCASRYHQIKPVRFLTPGASRVSPKFQAVTAKRNKMHVRACRAMHSVPSELRKSAPSPSTTSSGVRNAGRPIRRSSNVESWAGTCRPAGQGSSNNGGPLLVACAEVNDEL
jgi:hypothetical protein